MKKTLFLFAFLVLAPLFSVASTSAMSEKFVMDVYISTEGENVNALGGTLNYPSSWEVHSITMKSPDLLYWIEAPKADQFGKVDFSGILPGGMNTISPSSDQIALYSIEFWGTSELLSQVSFTEKEFYLNHPTALAATLSDFTYEVSTNSFYTNLLNTASILSKINYTFTEDPVSKQSTLVVDTYRSNLASYEFFTKEGDFGTGQWLSMDGVQLLASTLSTVNLNVRTADGDEQNLILRRSFASELTWATALGAGSALLIYLFYACFKIFRQKPEDLIGG